MVVTPEIFLSRNNPIPGKIVIVPTSRQHRPIKSPSHLSEMSVILMSVWPETVPDPSNCGNCAIFCSPLWPSKLARSLEGEHSFFDSNARPERANSHHHRFE